MPGNSRPSVLGALDALGIGILRVGNSREALHILETRPDVQAVLTEVTLPDGDWRTVLEAVAANCISAEVIVLSRFPDARLRRTVLESPAYDLLAEPYTRGEVARIVGGAVLTSYRRYLGIEQWNCSTQCSGGSEPSRDSQGAV